MYLDEKDFNLKWEGPTTNIWNDNQCVNVGIKSDSTDTLEDCQVACQETDSCTAINFKQSVGCVLRACSLPVPTSSWDKPGYEGYYQASGKRKHSWIVNYC